MNRARREVVVRLPDRQRSVQNIVRQHAVRNIHHAHFRINTEDHALHHTDEVVTRPVIGCKRDDRPMLCQIVLRKPSDETNAIHCLPFDANERPNNCQGSASQRVTLDCFFSSRATVPSPAERPLAIPAHPASLDVQYELSKKHSDADEAGPEGARQQSAFVD